MYLVAFVAALSEGYGTSERPIEDAAHDPAVQKKTVVWTAEGALLFAGGPQAARAGYAVLTQGKVEVEAFLALRRAVGARRALMTRPELIQWGGTALTEAAAVAAGVEYTPLGAYASFASEERLVSHFSRHGAEFGAKTADEYLDVARYVMQHGVRVEYSYNGELRFGYVLYMGNTRKGRAKFAFVGTDGRGNITTLHTKRGGDLYKTINDSKADNSIKPAPGPYPPADIP